MTTRIIITGAKGRMGQALAQCAARMPDLQVAAQIDMGDTLEAVIDKADVVIDFSFHSATADFAELCAKRRKAIPCLPPYWRWHAAIVSRAS